MIKLNRRQTLALGGATFLSELLLGGAFASAQTSDTLTIAYNVNLPSFDPTVGPSAVNPTIQAIYRAIYDQYVGQNPDLSFAPGLLTKWGWNDDKTKAWMDVREGVVWHDGSPLTPADVVWSLERAGDPKTGNPIQFVWGGLGNYQIDGNRITADVKQFDPTVFKWMAFLTGYILPKAYYEKVGAEGFEKKPVGAGPYMVDEYQGNAFLRLKRNEKYWGPKGAFETVIFKFVPDGTSRVAEIESGSAGRYARNPIRGVRSPQGEAGPGGRMRAGVGHRHDLHHQCRKRNARRERASRRDPCHRQGPHRQKTAARLRDAYRYAGSAGLRGVRSLDQGPYDPELAKSLLAKSGYSPEKPVKFKIQTTRGFKPKDYEMIQAIVGMWRKVGIDAEIEVYEIAKHYELRAGSQARSDGFLQLGQCDRRPVHLDGICDVLAVAALGLEVERSRRHDRAFVGREG